MCIRQNYLVFFSYIGTRFRGSQLQKVEKSSQHETVQYALETGFKEVFQEVEDRPFAVHLASRTDSGTHALKAAFTVRLPKYKSYFLDPKSFRKLMNSYFEDFKDIRISEVYKVPDTFKIHDHCRAKTYMYRIGVLKSELYNKKESHHNTIPITEFKRTELIRIERKFDIKKAEEAAHLFEGIKDFGAVVGKPSKNTCPTICNIMSFTVQRGQPFIPIDPVSQKYDYYHLICKGDRFLLHMVRRMVGLTLAASFGFISLADIKKLFDEPVPSSWPRGRVNEVPAHGLYLVDMDFPVLDFISPSNDQLPQSTDKAVDAIKETKVLGKRKVTLRN